MEKVPKYEGIKWDTTSTDVTAQPLDYQQFPVCLDVLNKFQAPSHQTCIAFVDIHFQMR